MVYVTANTSTGIHPLFLLCTVLGTFSLAHSRVYVTTNTYTDMSQLLYSVWGLRTLSLAHSYNQIGPYSQMKGISYAVIKLLIKLTMKYRHVRRAASVRPLGDI